jgi:hypothetical protein
LANNPEQRKESYHEVPASRYVFIANTAIHKRFFRYYTLILIAFMYVATRIVNVDLLLLQWHLNNLWIIAVYTVIGVGAAAIWQHEVTRDARKREAEAAKKLKWAQTYINNNLPDPEVEVNPKIE